MVGAGYVGLATAACLAHLGHRVVCADVVEEKIAALSDGIIPIVEEGLDDLVSEGLTSGRLSFVVGASGAAKGAEVVFLCVPTPQRSDGSADMSFIEAAAREIAPVLASESIVVNKSTVPVGSARVVEEFLRRVDVAVVSNPEFLREGSAIHDFLNPDRVVIGADDREAAMRVAALYSGLGAPLVITDPASAETIKYACNAFLATKISFVNTVANVCEAVGADVHDVILGIGYDTRIGFEFLKPGPGWGGSCFQKDTLAMVRIAEDAGYDFRFLKGVIEVNEEQKDIMVGKIRRAAGGSLAGVTIALWGLTFKARTDDVRDSPAISIGSRLIAEGAAVRAYDPTFANAASGHADRGRSPNLEVLPGALICADPYGAVEGARVLAVLTEWEELKRLDFSKVHELMAEPHVIDGRNLLNGAALKRLGFSYVGVGRS